jgi:hypothetical protein
VVHFLDWLEVWVFLGVAQQPTVACDKTGCEEDEGVSPHSYVCTHTCARTTHTRIHIHTHTHTPHTTQKRLLSTLHTIQFAVTCGVDARMVVSVQQKNRGV